MSKFICQNPDCPRFGLKEEHLTNNYKFKDGEFQSDNAPCPECGEIREEEDLNVNVPLSEKNVEIGKNSSASPDQKRDILKKRSHDHYEREIKPLKEYKVQETVKKFKNL